MGSRRDANRAEAIVKGVGALILLLGLWVVTMRMPQALKGKSPGEMLNRMLALIGGFAGLAFVVVALGLVIWFAVRKGK